MPGKMQIVDVNKFADRIGRADLVDLAVNEITSGGIRHRRRYAADLRQRYFWAPARPRAGRDPRPAGGRRRRRRLCDRRKAAAHLARAAPGPQRQGGGPLAQSGRARTLADRFAAADPRARTGGSNIWSACSKTPPRRGAPGTAARRARAVAEEMPLREVMTLICERVRVDLPGGRLLDPRGRCAKGGCGRSPAPSLPPNIAPPSMDWRSARGPARAAPAPGAAQPVTVEDIDTDPLWADYQGTCRSPLGLVACWSSPITLGNGRVAGTFAFYFREQARAERLARAGGARRACNLCILALRAPRGQGAYRPARLLRSL